jgi:hypothetical protein
MMLAQTTIRARLMSFVRSSNGWTFQSKLVATDGARAIDSAGESQSAATRLLSALTEMIRREVLRMYLSETAPPGRSRQN